MSKLPFTSVTYAMVSPEGCQAGKISFAGVVVRRRRPLPSAYISQRSKLPPSFGKAA